MRHTDSSLRNQPIKRSRRRTPKGGVEGEVGRLRRNHLVPVPEVADLAELNRLIRAGCEADLARTIIGRGETVGEALARERPLLRGLPAEPFDTSEPSSVRVDSKALVTVRQNRYSVPVALAGRRVLARVGAREITVVHDGREVARHERLAERYATSARLDHYLELLARKPGALAGSLALHQERERGAWPGCFDQLWQAIAAKVGAVRRQRAKWSTCCCSAASTDRSGSSSLFAAPWPPARTTAAPSPSSPTVPRTANPSRRWTVWTTRLAADRVGPEPTITEL